MAVKSFITLAPDLFKNIGPGPKCVSVANLPAIRKIVIYKRKNFVSSTESLQILAKYFQSWTKWTLGACTID